MNVLVAILTALLAGSLCSTVFAEIAIEMNQRGEYRVAVSTDHWERSGVNVPEEVEQYVERAKKAVESPGEFIPVVTRDVPREMVSPFGLKKDLVAYTGVIYLETNKEVVMVNDPTILSSSVSFSPFLVWWMFAFVAVILLNRRNTVDEAPILDQAMSLVAILGLLLALEEAYSVIPRLSTLLFFVSSISLIPVIGKQERKEKGVKYWAASAMIYVTLIILATVVYLT